MALDLYFATVNGRSITTVALLLVSFVAIMGAQNTTVEQSWISESQTLTGRVVVQGSGQAVSGATTELCSPDWKGVLSSTKTDANGYFALATPKTGNLFYLRFSAPGMNPYLLRVRIKKHATKELSIPLQVAS